MIWLLRLAALLAAFFFLRWLGQWLVRAVRGEPRASLPRRGTMERDPVCGTYVDVEVSVREDQGGQTLHFCSPRCRDAYRAGQPVPVEKTG